MFKCFGMFFVILYVLPIVALDAFACLRAGDSRIEALTIFFLAKGFLTITTFFRKIARMNPFLLYILFRLLNYFFVLFYIFTITTNTVLVASFAVGKTFTVHFKAKSFFACASDTFFLSRTCYRFLFL